MTWKDDYLRAVPVEPYFVEEAGIIWCADCRDILPHLPKVDLVLTDPPYGLNSKMNGGTWGTKYGIGDMQKWDYLIEQELVNDLIDSGKEVIVWGANHYIMPPSRCWLVWEKPKLPTISDIEMAWTNFDKPSKSKKANRISCHGGHPTEKPLSIIKWCLLFSDGAIILDPFLGSGTTAVAAKELGRRYVGIEIEEKYCAIAAKRLKQCNPLPFDKPTPKPKKRQGGLL